MSDLTRDAFEVLSYDDINSVLEDPDKKVWVHIDDVREAIAHAISRGRAEATPATTDDVERVARALVDEQYHAQCPDQKTRNEIYLESKELFDRDARAAIAALQGKPD